MNVDELITALASIKGKVNVVVTCEHDSYSYHTLLSVDLKSDLMGNPLVSLKGGVQYFSFLDDSWG